MELYYRKYFPESLETHNIIPLQKINVLDISTFNLSNFLKENEIISIYKIVIDCNFFSFEQVIHIINLFNCTQYFLDKCSSYQTSSTDVSIKPFHIKNCYPKKIALINYNSYTNDNYSQVINLLKKYNYEFLTKNVYQVTLNYEPKNHLRILRVLCISYDINKTDIYPHSKKFLSLYEYLDENFIDLHNTIKIDIKTTPKNLSTHDFNTFFDEQFPPDIIISQQFAIKQGIFLSNYLRIPHLVMITDSVGEYTYFFKENVPKPAAILAWDDNLTSRMKQLSLNIPIVNLKEGNFTYKIDYPEKSKDEQIFDIWDVLCYKVSIIIPCHGKHIFILDKLLNNLCSLSTPAYEVIVSFSLASGQKVEDVMPTISKYQSEYKIKLNLRSRFSLEPLITSVNRNVAASQAKGDILLFLDSDDIYHPQIIEVVQSVWRKHNPVNLHWVFRQGESVKEEDFLGTKYDTNNIPIEHAKKYYEKYFNMKEFFPWRIGYENISIHHGHHAMRRDAWENYQYEEMIPAGEDMVYFRNLLFKYPNDTYFLPQTHLTFYHQEFSLGTDNL